MCRLLGFSANSSSTLPGLLGDDLDNFISLSAIHCDGWGYSHVGHNSAEVEKFREPIPAVNSKHLVEQLSAPSDGGLLHFRWASKGLDIKEDNTHPFTHDGVTFIHNGSFAPFDVLKPFISEEFLALVKGETDSELYFYFLLTEIKKHGFMPGIMSAMRFIKDNISHSSANMIIMNQDLFITACRYNQDRIPELFKKDIDYYELRYKMIDGSVVVASSGWEQTGWTLLENDSLLVVDRSDQSISLSKI